MNIGNSACYKLHFNFWFRQKGVKNFGLFIQQFYFSFNLCFKISAEVFFKDYLFSKYAKFSRKTKISYPLIRTSRISHIILVPIVKILACFDSVKIFLSSMWFFNLIWKCADDIILHSYSFIQMVNLPNFYSGYLKNEKKIFSNLSSVRLIYRIW